MIPNDRRTIADSLARFVAKVVVVAVSGLVAVPPGHAQQVLEIDLESGRTVISDDHRAMHLSPLAVDHSRGIIYVRDLEEPDGIIAFSLETGERLRTYRIAKGDGPNEVREIQDFAVASGGGLYVLGPRKVLHLGTDGGLRHELRLRGPASEICEFEGQPTVAIQRGLRKHGPNGAAENIGAHVVTGDTWVVRMGDDLSEVRKWRRARLACRRDVAFLVFSNTTTEPIPGTNMARVSNIAPDSVLAYVGNGRESRLDVPTDFSEEYGWNEDLEPSIDSHGNLVLASLDGRIPGAIIDPDTGCYSVLRHREPRLGGRFVGIYQDSAIVFHQDRDVTTRNGQRVVTLFSEARQASVNPIRRVSGDPCVGMLPSVGPYDR